MNPGIPFFIGSFNSLSFAGVGASPTSPEPYKASKSFPLTTLRKAKS
jgi:hypothetical protein